MAIYAGLGFERVDPRLHASPPNLHIDSYLLDTFLTVFGIPVSMISSPTGTTPRILGASFAGKG
jgi:hypothetical protein